jgi:DNA-directed RNA polymerase, mitochondrial
LNCIGDLFRGAQDIQNWFTACATLVCKSIPGERIDEAIAAVHAANAKNDEASGKKTKTKKTKVKSGLTMEDVRKEQMTSVMWTTPLGVPVVQPYRQTKRKQVMTAIQSVYIEDPSVRACGKSRSSFLEA